MALSYSAEEREIIGISLTGIQDEGPLPSLKQPPSSRYAKKAQFFNPVF